MQGPVVSGPRTVITVTVNHAATLTTVTLACNDRNDGNVFDPFRRRGFDRRFGETAQLRQDADAVNFVRAVLAAGKPVEAICRGPGTVIVAGVVTEKPAPPTPASARTLSTRTPPWSDEEVVTDAA